MSTALLRASIEGFSSVVHRVGPSQWSLPTACDGWDGTALMGHVVGGCLMSSAAVRGASLDEVLAVFGRDNLGADPTAAYLAAIDDHVAAFAEPGALERVCHHPAGDLPGAVLLNFRIGDFLLHGWDLAHPLGIDYRPDADVVAHVWATTSPMAPMLAQSGMFGEGPSGSVGEDAPLFERLLDLMGRRP